MRRFAVTISVIVAGALLALPSCSSGSSTTSEPSPALAAGPAVDPTGAVLIDVRTPEEFAAGHLEGAVNIDVQSADFAAQVAALDPTARYLVYCRSGNRSAVAVSIMSSLGFSDLTDLGGVPQASSATGLPVV